jgi:hypothetical protein
MPVGGWQSCGRETESSGNRRSNGSRVEGFSFDGGRHDGVVGQGGSPSLEPEVKTKARGFAEDLALPTPGGGKWSENTLPVPPEFRGPVGKLPNVSAHAASSR